LNRIEAREHARALKAEGKTTREIATLLGFSPASISRWTTDGNKKRRKWTGNDVVEGSISHRTAGSRFMQVTIPPWWPDDDRVKVRFDEKTMRGRVTRVREQKRASR